MHADVRARAPRFVTLCAAVCLGLSLSAAHAHAYCRLTTTAPRGSEVCASGGVPLYWSRSCITYSVTARAEGTIPALHELRDVVDRAFATWSEIACDAERPSERIGLSLRQTQDLSECSVPDFDEDGSNLNAIVFVEDWVEQEYPEVAFGLTLVWHDKRSGEILDADMLLNESLGPLTECGSRCPSAAVDLQNVITHEAGHFLGLGHSDEATACMWGRAELGEISKRDLTRDDQDGLCEIYGARSAPQCLDEDFDPRGGFTARCEAAEQAAALKSKLKAGGGDSGCMIAPPGAGTRARWPAFLLLSIAVCLRQRQRRDRVTAR